MMVVRDGEMVRLSGQGFTLLLDLATARRIGQQAGGEPTTPAGPIAGVRILGEYDHMWDAASGGDRNSPSGHWREGDEELAAEAYGYFPEPARRLVALWTANPGRLFDAEELVAELGLKNRSALAGVLNGFHKGCAAVGRTFPFYWWKGQGRRQPSLYATRPSVAAIFIAAVG